MTMQAPVINPPDPKKRSTRPEHAGMPSRPLNDFLSAMEHSLRESPGLHTGIILGCLLLSWWIYVPVHELLHALGCVISGGSVTRLDLSPVYGAVFLKKIFPFISPGSEYAGQLKGFDTSGSDLTYLITVFLPYTLTIFPGVLLLKTASAEAVSPLSGSIRLGISIPLAYAPFISLTGDYYEISSIVVSRLVPLASHGFSPLYWRSDDLIKLSQQLLFTGNAPDLRDVAGLTVSFVLAIVLAFCTYAAGDACSRILICSRGKKKPV